MWRYAHGISSKSKQIFHTHRFHEFHLLSKTHKRLIDGEKMAIKTIKKTLSATGRHTPGLQDAECSDKHPVDD